MYRLVDDVEVFRRYWHTDQQQMPQWFIDANKTWITTEEDYLHFCRDCWRIYELNETALLYVQRMNDLASIHFSTLRGSDTSRLIPDFIEIRQALFDEVPWICGWVMTKNLGLRKILTTMGFFPSGLEMIHGESHGRVLQWWCYVAGKQDFSLQ